MNTLISLLFLAAVGGSIYAYVKLKSGEIVRFETTSTPRQVTMTAVSIVGTTRRWTTLSQGDGAANFTYVKGASKLLVVLLCFTIFGIPLAILYALIAGKHEALTVNTDDTSTAGMTIVQVSSNGYRGKRSGRQLRDQMALAGGSTAQIEGMNSGVGTVMGGGVSAGTLGPAQEQPATTLASPRPSQLQPGA